MSRTLFALAVLALLGAALAPTAWQVLTSIKTDGEITARPAVYWPRQPTLEPYRALFERKPIGRYLVNSLRTAGVATTLCLLAAIPAAYGLRRTGRQRRQMGLGFLAVVALFPPVLLLFPLYEVFRALGWLNHMLSLVLPYAALNLPLAIWALDSALRQIPPEIDDAATLDGLSMARRLFLIQVPLAASGIAAAAILVFIFSWNEFLLALTFMTRDEAKTITAGIASVSGSSIFEIPWGQLSAATVVATAPLLVLVLVAQRYVVQGVTRGAIKE